MQLFKNLGFKAKLLLLCLFLSAVSFTIAATSYVGFRKVTEKYNKVADVSLPSFTNLSEMFLQYKDIRINLRSLGLPGLSKNDAEYYIKHVKEAIAGYEAADKLYTSNQFIKGEKELYDNVNKEWAKFKAVGVRALTHYDAGTPQDHEKLMEIFLVECPAAADSFLVAMNKLKAFHLSHAKMYVEEAQAASEKTNNLSLTLGTLGLIAGLVLGALFSNSIVSTMLHIVDNLRENSEKVSVASTQIAEASGELSRATATQASSLEETASAIEEMSAAVTKNSENAGSTAENSASSQEKAINGKMTVERMIQSMGAINEGNNNLVSQINHSNEKMSDIVKIIEEIGNKTKIINDIVFQTKLLSFNASVEAARAGQHGKGFAVVAEEIGKLAQMSGNSAHEISALLETSVQTVNQIASETKSKVQVIVEEGKQTVDGGIEVANQCNHVLEEIVHNISRVSTMAGEIATASQEQAKGVAEVKKSIVMLDQMTQQNATTSEDCASAAKQLSNQARALNEVVEELTQTIVGRGNKHISKKLGKISFMGNKEKSANHHKNAA